MTNTNVVLPQSVIFNDIGIAIQDVSSRNINFLFPRYDVTPHGESTSIVPKVDIPEVGS